MGGKKEIYKYIRFFRGALHSLSVFISIYCCYWGNTIKKVTSFHETLSRWIETVVWWIISTGWHQWWHATLFSIQWWKTKLTGGYSLLYLMVSPTCLYYQAGSWNISLHYFDTVGWATGRASGP